MSRTVIGISGVAGAGKDLFFNLLSKHLPVRRFALADALKRDVCNWCIDRYGIDPTSCSRRDKEMIREFLVFHGAFKRKQSQGRCWIDKLDNEIKSFQLNAVTEDIPCITDIRYQEYESDEVNWVKKELNGVLVHVSQYEMKEVTSVTQPHITEIKKVFREPINFEEARQDPILKSEADYLIKWEKIKGDNLINDEYLNNEVKKFTDWYHGERENK